MTRGLSRFAWPLVAVLLIALLGVGVALYLSVTGHALTKAALREAVAYSEGRAETDDSLATVPTEPDAVLERLRACAGGRSCSSDP